MGRGSVRPFLLDSFSAPKYRKDKGIEQHRNSRIKNIAEPPYFTIKISKKNAYVELNSAVL